MALQVNYYNDTTHAVYSLDSDPTAFAWGNTNARLYAFLYRSDTQETYIKTGPDTQDWTLVGGGGSPTDVQMFQYTVTGLEPDAENLTITIPTEMLDADYGVVVTQGDADALLGFNIAEASKTTTEFVLSLSGAAVAGDTFNILVRSF